MNSSHEWYSVRKLCRLYDPRVSELQTLLNKQAFFPSGEFADEIILDILANLGLRRSLGRKGLLDSARSVAMICTSDKHEARNRALALLTHLDDLELAKENLVAPDTQLTVSSAVRNPQGTTSVVELKPPVPTSSTARTSLVQAGGKVETHHVVAAHNPDDSETLFWQQLMNISWCPVFVDPPDTRLPWPSQRHTPVAPPKVVRSKSQMWLVSASMRILDGECRSQTLPSMLGWTQSPNVAVLAEQLVEMARVHAQWNRSPDRPSGDSESDGMENSDMNAKISDEIPVIYKYLQELVDTDDLTILQPMLEGANWVWVGDSFVSPRELAFDSPAHFHPYLHVVPSQIVEFRKLLSKLGVREAFEFFDYARVLARIADDAKGRSVSSEQLTFCFRVLEALVEVLPAQSSVSGKYSVGAILIPDSSGVLMPAKDLVYNDAPWLAKSVAGLAGMRRLVHPEIENELAERLGAKSLRYLSLVDQEMTSNLPCLEAGMIDDIISSFGDEDLLLFDLLEIADCCKVQKVHVLYDKREHPRQSLLQPNLGELGESFRFCGLGTSGSSRIADHFRSCECSNSDFRTIPRACIDCCVGRSTSES